MMTTAMASVKITVVSPPEIFRFLLLRFILKEKKNQLNGSNELREDLVNFISEAKSVWKQDVFIMRTYSSEFVQWSETRLSLLAISLSRMALNSDIYVILETDISKKNFYFHFYSLRRFDYF